jgi:hypothetical protein
MNVPPIVTSKTIETNALTISVCILLFLIISPGPMQGQGRDQFVTGANYPWIAYGHDFGKNEWGHDGFMTAGWTYQTFSNTQGFTDARFSKLRVHAGMSSLAVTANLVGKDPNRAQGEVYLDLQNHTPKGVAVPVNLQNVTVHSWVFLPKGSAGSSQAPNGLQLFFKSKGLDPLDPLYSLYSPFQNIRPEWEENWVEFTANASGPAGFADPAYDPTRIIEVGLKVAINDQSTAVINGKIFLDDYLLATSSPIVFDFEQLEIEKDFSELQAALSQCSMSAVRVFIFADGRASPDFTAEGDIVGLDEYFFQDFDTLLVTARLHNLFLIPVLLDFHWFDTPQFVSGVQVGGHSDILRDATRRQAFLDRVLKPLAERYRDDSQILAWEIINEPEWAMQEVPKDFQIGDPVTVAEMQDFVRLCAQTIHASTSTKVTVGSARRLWLNYWRGLGLDLYQFHWYDKFERSLPLDVFPWQPYVDLGLDKPCLVGEIPTASTRHSASEFLNAAFNRGYQGLLVWSYRAGDDVSNFSGAKPLLQTWCANSTNPIDDADFFVRQHYYDFLDRQPDPGGLAYWTGQLTQCNTDQTCLRDKRIDVSNAFFYEQEYQQTGAYVYRLYRAAYGNNQPSPNPDNSNSIEAHKLPSYASFAPDRAQVVGGADLSQSQLGFANAFVQRAEFLAKYPASLDGPGFVDAVLVTMQTDLGVNLGSQRDALINLFDQAGGGSAGRGAVLYRLADDNLQTNPVNNRAFIDAEYNRAFVFTQYAGYLRRNADMAGFLFWFGQVNSGPLRDVTKQHAMVCSFITSAEYQLRFSSVVTHSNAECPQ